MLTENQVKMAFEYACKLDVFSVKPGNVFHGHPAYGMTHKDFLQSSMACSDVICEKNMDIGEKILECIVTSTAAVVPHSKLIQLKFFRVIFLWRCYYLHTPRYSVSSECGNFR